MKKKGASTKPKKPTVKTLDDEPPLVGAHPTKPR